MTELVLGSEELETLLHVLGDAAALPGRLAPDWHTDNAEVVRRTAAHSLLARGLIQRANGSFLVQPELAELLAVPTRPAIGFEFDLERAGEVLSGAAGAATERGLLVLPRPDGTVLVRGFAADALAQAVVDVAGSAPPGPASLDLPRAVLAEPLASADQQALRERGLNAEDAAALARILAGRTGSGRAFAVRQTTPDAPNWISSPLPVAWWDTADGRYLLTPGPVGHDGQRLISVRGCTDLELRNALAELTAVLV